MNFAKLKLLRQISLFQVRKVIQITTKKAEKSNPDYSELGDPLSQKFDKRTDKTLASYDPTIKATVGLNKSEIKQEKAKGNAGKG